MNHILIFFTLPIDLLFLLTITSVSKLTYLFIMQHFQISQILFKCYTFVFYLIECILFYPYSRSRVHATAIWRGRIIDELITRNDLTKKSKYNQNCVYFNHGANTKLFRLCWVDYIRRNYTRQLCYDFYSYFL